MGLNPTPLLIYDKITKYNNRKKSEVNFMNKKTMTIATVAAAGTAVFMGGTDTFASEAPVKDVNTEVTQPATTTKVTDEQVLNAKSTVDSKKADVTKAQNEVNKVAQKVATKTEAKNTLTTEKEKVTKDVEDAKNAKPEDVAKIATNIKNEETNKVAKTKELDAAKTNEQAKKADVTAKANEVAKAEDKLAQATDEVKAKEKALDPQAEVIAKEDVAKATKELADKESTKADAKVELDKAKAHDKELTAKKITANADVITKVKDVENKTEDVNKATVAKADAQKALDNAFPYPTKLKTSPEWAKAFGELLALDAEKFDSEAWKANNPQKPGEDGFDYYKRERAAANEFIAKKSAKRDAKVKELIKIDERDNENKPETPTNEKDSKIVYEINNIPTDVLEEASQYFAHLVNGIRQDVGIKDKMYVHKDAIEFAREVAKSVVDNKIKEFKHFGRGINDAARKRGLLAGKAGVDTTAQAYENLAGIWLQEPTITREKLFQEIHDIVYTFFHEGPQNGHYMHATTLATDKTTGLALSYVEGADFVQLHAIGINPIHVKDGSYEARYGAKTVLPSVNYVDINTLKDNVAKTTTELTNAQTALETAKDALNKAKAKVEELNKIKAQTPEAQAKYDKAVADVQKASDEKAKAEQRLNDVTMDKATKEKALNDAMRMQEIARAALISTKAQHVVATKAYNDAVEARINIEKEIATISERINTLTEEKSELENKIAKRAENEARLVEIDKEISKLNDELNNLSVEEATLKVTVDKLNDELAKSEKAYTTLLGIYTAERIPQAPVVEELPKIDIEEFTRNEEVPFNTIETEDTNVPVGEKVVKQEGVNGQRTVKVLKFIDNGILKAIEEKVVTEIKPINKIVAVGVEKPTTKVEDKTNTPKVTNKQYKYVGEEVARVNKAKVGAASNKVLPNTGVETTTTTAIGALGLLGALGLRRKANK